MKRKRLEEPEISIDKLIELYEKAKQITKITYEEIAKHSGYTRQNIGKIMIKEQPYYKYHGICITYAIEQILTNRIVELTAEIGNLEDKRKSLRNIIDEFNNNK
jgi:hypothetical protein